MLMKIDNILNFQPHHTTGEVTSCAQEIVTYISNHDNWQKPILPQEPGCSQMEFEPERFDFEYNKWFCDQNSAKDGMCP